MSKHLQSILDKNNQLATLQVVFLDIEKYSQRRTSNQVVIINEFTKCLQKSLIEIGQEYLEFIQKNDYNFKTDIIVIPTGDGAAVNFTFEGLHNIHIQFAQKFLKNQFDHNQSTPQCEKFEENGWCNCHSKFNSRIGISEGKAIVYKDINNNYNVAGNPINMAARLLGEANRNQIILTESAFRQLIDLEEDPNYADKFIEVLDVKVKHGISINLYIFKSDDKFINSLIPDHYIKEQKLLAMKEKMEDLMGPNFNSNESYDEIGNKIQEMTSLLGEMLHTLNDATTEKVENTSNSPHQIIPQKKKTRRG